ncbi:MAG: tetratricopeptide repeat protein [Cyanobacteria bacterium P01_G01_bin.54]
MTQTRSSLQRIILILGGVAFLSVPIFASLSFLRGEQATQGEGYPAESEGGAVTEEESYAVVVEREPENLYALQKLVEARIELGKFEEALDPLETLNELAPDNPQILRAIAEINIQLQQFPEAIGPLEQLAELQPENAELQQQVEALKQIIETGEVPTLANPDAPASEAPDPLQPPNTPDQTPEASPAPPQPEPSAE